MSKRMPGTRGFIRPLQRRKRLKTWTKPIHGEAVRGAFPAPETVFVPDHPYMRARAATRADGWGQMPIPVHPDCRALLARRV